MDIRILLFLLGSGFLVFISRISLRIPGSHGFYRFFAWECILALFLYNAAKWFAAPFTPVHLFAWICLFVSAYLIIAAVYELRRFGKQGVQRDNEPLLRFEKTTNLVTSGIYKYIRHPMYSSLLFLAWGIFLKDISWLTTLLVIAATILLYLTAVRDEEESQRFFGYDYQEYKFHTRMFVPFLF